MGLIPIVLALSLFILLWGMVNYNSFVTKKSAVELLAVQKERLIVRRSEELLKAGNLLQSLGYKLPEELIRTANQPFQVPQKNVREGIEKLKEMVEDTPLLKHNQDMFQVMENIVEISIDLQRFEKKHMAAVLDYNKQVREMPSRYIANAFGFKSLPA
jgi:hypothetical protein